jgi:serine/threonine protein kinase
MSIAPGVRLGPYEIVSPIGAGGMGEVYRARDMKLGRDVAIKVLPAQFVADPSRRARFEREAHALASLNHPHIATIYGIEDVDGVQALVLELIEGETLRERLIRGPLPVSDALRYARAIAEALDAAHERGIIHRDLKPSNVKITPSGTVKVLDFGLAKIVEGNVDAPASVGSPTVADDGTQEGTIFGTAAYMSPEQARGKPTDKRVDIWGFGCVLYEMLTGQTAFAGETASDTIAAILDRQPDWHALPGTVPHAINRLLRRCLEKDVNRRLRDIGDARIELEDALASPASETFTGIDRRQPTKAQLMWVAVSLLVGVAIAGIFASRMTVRPVPAVEPVRFSFVPPPMPNPFGVSISPDGRLVAFPAAPANGPRMLFLRSIDSLESRPLAGTEGVLTAPFWSPDGRFVGFASERKLKTVSVVGGLSEVLADLSGAFFGGTWNSDNMILFSDGGSLYRVPAGGGTRPVLQMAGGTFPGFLPDGRHYLYLAHDQLSGRTVYIGSLDSGEVTRVMASESRVAYAPPRFLVFTRQRKLLAQQFDITTLRLTGEPIAIADNVLYRPDNGAAAFAVAGSRAVVYRADKDAGQRSLIWVDRSGKPGSPMPAELIAEFIRLSPDGTRVAFSESRAGAASDIWTYDLARDMKTPITDHPSIDHYPVWSPDGSRIGFDSDRLGKRRHGLFDRRADGAAPEQPLIHAEPGMSYQILDWTRGFLLFAKQKLGDEQVTDIWAMPLSGDRKPFPYLTRVTPTNAALSPDGRWVAYVASESGTNQVIVRSFPDPSQRRQQVSPKGGASPLWRADGRELFYVNTDGRLVAVPVSVDRAVTPEKSSALFIVPGFPVPPSIVGYPYGVTPDGQRFLFNVPPGGLVPSTPISVVLNWADHLPR